MIEDFTELLRNIFQDKIKLVLACLWIDLNQNNYWFGEYSQCLEGFAHPAEI